MGRKANPVIVPDAEYLKAAMEAAGLNQAELAQRIMITSNKPGSMLSRSLKGDRPFTLWEVVGMAKQLKRDLYELATKVGVPIEPPGVPVVGKITAESRASPVIGYRKGQLVPFTHPSPNLAAYIYEPTGTVFIADKGSDDQMRADDFLDALDRPCIVAADSYDLPLLGKLERAAKRGIKALRLYYGGDVKELTKIHSVEIVIDIRNP
jgi:transcriptional regulator with XRE-family HTH domain